MSYRGQSGQDAFVRWCYTNKRDGWFVEIGSNDPIHINNTYDLEKVYGWRGIMVEYNSKFLDSYKKERPSSIHILQDATKVDYRKEFEQEGLPKQIEYLQIDLEVKEGTTLRTLQNLQAVMDLGYTFGVVTFEHDIYQGDHYSTRAESRKIFERYGYVRVFSDVKNDGNPYEDWYIHPSMVDLGRFEGIRAEESLEYTEILKRIGV